MKKQLFVTILLFLMILGICGSSMACEVKNTSKNYQNYECGNHYTNYGCHGHHFKQHRHHWYKHNRCGNDDKDTDDNSTDLPNSI